VLLAGAFSAERGSVVSYIGCAPSGPQARANAPLQFMVTP
jgi:hypothetical protein